MLPVFTFITTRQRAVKTIYNEFRNMILIENNCNTPRKDDKVHVDYTSNIMRYIVGGDNSVLIL